MSNDAIGWSDCDYISKKMGELQPTLLRYVVSRTGDDFMLQVNLLELENIIHTIREKTRRTDPHKPGKVIFPPYGNKHDLS